MIIDDFCAAMKRGDRAHAAALLEALRHFTSMHHDEVAAAGQRRAR